MKSIVRHFCEVCGSDYSNASLAHKCEKSGLPPKPDYPTAPGENLTIKTERGNTSAVFRGWIVALDQRFWEMSDDDLTMVPLGTVWHVWLAKIDSPLDLSKRWPGIAARDYVRPFEIVKPGEFVLDALRNQIQKRTKWH